MISDEVETVPDVVEEEKVETKDINDILKAWLAGKESLYANLVNKDELLKNDAEVCQVMIATFVNVQECLKRLWPEKFIQNKD